MADVPRILVTREVDGGGGGVDRVPGEGLGVGVVAIGPAVAGPGDPGLAPRLEAGDDGDCVGCSTVVCGVGEHASGGEQPGRREGEGGQARGGHGEGREQGVQDVGVADAVDDRGPGGAVQARAATALVPTVPVREATPMAGVISMVSISGTHVRL
ncbi:hypothetical protein ACFWBF_11170 [Streptomyces sp. NPDC060028]|uniref:hypothetical protein n=1 Tax=Streptomyces sp. NPDC060028 TaxID=3347041 RepID=UPI003699A598